MSRTGIVALLAALGAPLVAAALEAPHDQSNAFSCADCHMGHRAVGVNLTNNSVNSALCDSCHSSSTNFGFPWTSNMQAQAGAAGSSHSWSALASNLGATIPDPLSANSVERALGRNLDTGNRIKCSTCHDVHQSLASGSVHTSVALATNVACATTCGTGTLQLTSVPAAARAGGYVIQVNAANQFKISKDNGLTYLGWSGSAWGAGLPNGKPYTAGTPVTLDDNATTITIAGAPTVGATWAKFTVSYPFLRADAATICITCHKDRHQSSANVEALGGTIVGTGAAIVPGTTVFSHPVGEALANAYDRPTPLDADGATTTDGNPTNDLKLGAGGVVNCITCHHVHNADSNSLSVDPR